MAPDKPITWYQPASRLDTTMGERALAAWVLLSCGWRINQVSQQLQCSRAFVQRVAERYQQDRALPQ